MFSAIGGKNYVYMYQYQCQQRAKVSWKISLHQILAKNPKLHIPDAELFVVQHLNYWMYEYK